MKRRFAISLACLSSFADVAAATSAESDYSYITYAGNGEGIPQPNSNRTCPVDVSTGTIAVPEGMVYIPAGPFSMGVGTTAKTVELPAYFIGKYDVTNAEYKAFIDATRSEPPAYWVNGLYPSGKANHPVIFVSLPDAAAYCSWVSRETGRTALIPTAAQWEKAARGPKGYLYPWGNSRDVRYDSLTGAVRSRFNFNAVTAAYFLREHPNSSTWYDDEKSPYYRTQTTIAKIAAYDLVGRPTRFAISSNGMVSGWVNHETRTGFIHTDAFSTLKASGGNTTPVGSFPAGRSTYGCYDMAGNVFQWTTTLITATNGFESEKVCNEIRGGSWYANGNSCVSTSIGEGRFATGVYNTVGFRIVSLLP